jgi:MFS family permease
MPTVESDPPQLRDPYAALRFRDYRLFVVGRFLLILGYQMQSVAIGWELYERSGSALLLGGVGLVQVIPIMLLTLPAGQVADQFDRRRTILIAEALLIACALALAYLSWQRGPIWLIYGCLLLNGVGRAFNKPATDALLPQLLPLQIFSNAATWSSVGFQLASVSGPALAGVMIAIQKSAIGVYLVDTGVTIICFLLFAAISKNSKPGNSSQPLTLSSLGAGIHFLRHNRVILAAMVLDLFAVLLGGATTLLPIFARDILQVGPAGLGWLRAAPSMGAVLMAVVLAHRPPLRQAGILLVGSVAMFGLVTIVFGLSQSFGLSLLMLGIAGAVDSISVVIRQTLVQVRTPNELRGRVSAINSVCIASSNELGGFESGLVAGLFGPVVSVVSGGIGTILVVVLIALIWPEIWKLKSLQDTP